MPRKPKELPTTIAVQHRRRDDKSLLYGKYPNNSLPSPNHLLPEDERDEASTAELGVHRRFRWPLSCLLRRTDHNTDVGVFVHERYGASHWSEWADQPPTWMDPNLLVAMALQDPQLKAVLDKGFKRNDARVYEIVESQLRRVFEEEYLPWIINEFSEHGIKPVAMWLTNADVSRRLDKVDRASRRGLQKP